MLTQTDLLTKKGVYIQQMFGSIARVYDLLNTILSFNFDKSWRKFAVKVSNVTPDAKVLDVCTGTGDLAIAYSRVLNGSGRVIGSDFCHEMVRLAELKLKRRNLSDKIKVIDADTLRLPFRDNSFQVSGVAFGIRNVADLRAGIAEMVRITAPGGRVVILEFSQPINPVFKGIYYFYFKKILPFIGRLISRSKYNAYSYLPSSVLNFPDRYGLRTQMESCGLEDVKIYPKTLGIVTVHVGTKPGN
ncbi:MAG: bifunctional demethylmenaquinone methyltransferase/2-methoxy-6-polyprenyl-1,4-benzoquinol methylase UbiE [Candidatus Brocadia sp.]|jgi:demethylmenaquinone methyltransferase/2-methoxy-6-polyprenyl-1,4-benzoquinol methylase|uniref:Demethylmenaquinone methyltransferase n=1 Tax=Candidatus Brocadia fulgida TaxID=380242 RepID=A0A0M2UWU2_9BACT|nr:MAG: ubiquinone/menaquinone biosynthesis methyltransferase [Candidatus Brocadia fulgida]MCC6326758.1 bifunctional demethylmenaquinone methyltransferase/2-methoxy-6-polyprenyl-1,4-benzoquinol methylase UbiE [Candidatus Brocadia sp.]MCE7912894.1 bifunctional demethylmenaquinone methyltransferase/2-methoxy-6-polyprenyl-1,4-benzoquinol methylase UbiE [Candidatus Brocadia sp. AMX3]MDG5998190.1 bifunctional demethylmenaquinone methyltransferase/2-methoxy-6-polyprenyl-1,4-benzoquinol methylase UbiE 